MRFVRLSFVELNGIKNMQESNTIGSLSDPLVGIISFLLLQLRALQHTSSIVLWPPDSVTLGTTRLNIRSILTHIVLIQAGLDPARKSLTLLFLLLELFGREHTLVGFRHAQRTIHYSNQPLPQEKEKRNPTHNKTL